MYSSFNAGGEESGTSGDNNDETQLPFLRGVTLLEGGWVDNVLQVGEYTTGRATARDKQSSQLAQLASPPRGTHRAFQGLVLPS